jgi:hypothetical protein
MILIKKIDVEKHFAAKRAMRRNGALRQSRPDVRNILAIKTAGAQISVKVLTEDVSLEHSSSNSLISPSK